MMSQPLLQHLRFHSTRRMRLSAIMAACLMGFAVAACGPSGTGGAAPTPTPTSTPTSVPFTVTSVELSVTPASIAGTTCGSSNTFTYVAVFHTPAHTAGGTIQFSYTLNNGRSQIDGTVATAPGATSTAYTFASSGLLPADHTYPGVALVMVTSPNTVISLPAQPSGACTVSVPSGPFQVTSVSMAVSPSSIAGMSCGTAVTVRYTAMFQLAPNGPGGTIHFQYTVNNGRGSAPATITVAPGQTTASYAFLWSGTLPADHTYPEPGGVMVQSPNQVQSPLLGPSGTCS